MASKLFCIGDLISDSFKGIAAKAQEGGTAFLIASGAVFPDRLKSEKFKPIYQLEKRKQLKRGDILFNTGGVGTLGRSGFFDINGGDYFPDSFILVLRFENPNVSSKYLFYALQTDLIESQVLQKTSGTTGISSIKPKDVLAIKIPMPVTAKGVLDLEEQERIVLILEKVEEMKRKRREVDQKMTDLPPALFAKMFGNPEKNEMRWKTERLDSLCRTIYRYPTFYGFEYTKIGTPVVRIGNILQDGILDPDLSHYVFVPEGVNKRFPRTVIELHDIVMAVRGDGSTGKRIGLATSQNLLGANISPNLLIFKTRSNVLDPIFLFYLMTSAGGQSLIGRRITRTAKKTITAADIAAIEIPLPPIELQTNFSEQIRSIQNLKASQEASTDKIREISATLMATAFSNTIPNDKAR